MDPNRRTYQLINGVLVETTIEEVLPKVEANKDGLYSITQNLQEKLDKLSKEINIYQVRIKFRIIDTVYILPPSSEPILTKINIFSSLFIFIYRKNIKLQYNVQV